MNIVSFLKNRRMVKASLTTATFTALILGGMGIGFAQGTISFNYNPNRPTIEVGIEGGTSPNFFTLLYSTNSEPPVIRSTVFPTGPAVVNPSGSTPPLQIRVWNDSYVDYTTAASRYGNSSIITTQLPSEMLIGLRGAYVTDSWTFLGFGVLSPWIYTGPTSPNLSDSPEAIPEPSTLSFLVIGLIVAGAFCKKRRKTA